MTSGSVLKAPGKKESAVVGRIRRVVLARAGRVLALGCGCGCSCNSPDTYTETLNQDGGFASASAQC